MVPVREDGGEHRLEGDGRNAFYATFETPSTRSVNGRSRGAGENIVRG